MDPPSFEMNLDELPPPVFQPLAIVPGDGVNEVIDVEQEAGPNNPIIVDDDGSEHESQAPSLQSASTDTSSEEDEEEDEDDDMKGDDDSHSDDNDDHDDDNGPAGGADDASNSSSQTDEQFDRDDLSEQGNGSDDDANMDADDTPIEEVEVVETMETDDDPVVTDQRKTLQGVLPVPPPEEDSLEKLEEDMRKAEEEQQRFLAQLGLSTVATSSSTAMPPPNSPKPRKNPDMDAEQANNSALSKVTSKLSFAKVLEQAGTYQTEEVLRSLEVDKEKRAERQREYEALLQQRKDLYLKYYDHVDNCNHMFNINCQRRAELINSWFQCRASGATSASDSKARKLELIRIQQSLEKSRPGREALWFLDGQPANFDTCKAHQMLGYPLPRFSPFEAWMTNHEKYQDRKPDGSNRKVPTKVLRKKSLGSDEVSPTVEPFVNTFYEVTNAYQVPFDASTSFEEENCWSGGEKQEREWRRAVRHRKKALTAAEESLQKFHQMTAFREQTALAVLDKMRTRECPEKASKRDKQVLNSSISGNQSD